MREGFKHAVLFSRRAGDRRELHHLCGRAVTTLSAVWHEEPRREPWFQGHLAPFQLKPGTSFFRPEEVVIDTGYEFSGIYHSLEVIGRKLPGGGVKSRDLVAVCGDGKMPGFVQFVSCVGGHGRSVFREGLALAAKFFSIGYIGGIHCHSDSLDNKMFDNPERVTISISEEGLLGVRIHWGDEALVGPLLDLCRAEKMIEEDGREEWEKRDAA